MQESTQITESEWQQRAPASFPPAWASAWGDDRYGLWADFCVGDVVQRMRWIEAGSFIMGSPKEELDRQEREGPQHRVTISQGFWLADTACTQALWQTVMGENPSHFNDQNKGGPLHPVERVNWLMVQTFLQKLAQVLPEALPSLPTEAEWEYACRAGTQTPFSFGATITTEQVNYDGNHPYADAEKGEYRGCTLAAASFARNAWGLYQMHGNVWEWCADSLREYTADAVTDPGLPQAMTMEAGDKEGRRAVRGGGWFSDALGARSAYRDRYAPDDAVNVLGWRLALRSTSQ